MYMKVGAVTGGDKTWLNSLVLHFNVSEQFNGEETGAGGGRNDPGCGQVIHLCM